jgi:riboflavin synthase
MFTGIIESLGIVVAIEKDKKNIHFTIESPISKDLKIDQSVAHNGVCLTVTEKTNSNHKVTAIDETILKTNFNQLQVGSTVNLERCLKMGARLDGHMVQGHVDDIAICEQVIEDNGSWRYIFKGNEEARKLLVNKGSVCINGVSLTVVEANELIFDVAIIPYTYDNTTFKFIKKGQSVNIEYDIIGKYILKNYSNKL